VRARRIQRRGELKTWTMVLIDVSAGKVIDRNQFQERCSTHDPTVETSFYNWMSQRGLKVNQHY
jgi:hypothetical protein